MSEQRDRGGRRRNAFLGYRLTRFSLGDRSPAGLPAFATVAAMGVLVTFGLPGFARSQVTHHPISAKLLKVKSTPSGVEAVFLSTDPGWPFPAIGSADDPRLLSSDLTFELFSEAQAEVGATIPHLSGNPGWKVRALGADSYKYRNPSPNVFQISSAALIEGKRVRVRAPLTLPARARLGKVAVRFRTGSLWSCALFAGESIRRDDGLFIGKNAPAPGLTDCSNATLVAAVSPGCSTAAAPACAATCPGGAICAPDAFGSACRCVHPTQPCGATGPICGGECGAGEQCYPMDDLIPGSINGCACAPIGAPPCGATGETCESGGCPVGLECQRIPPLTPLYDSSCGCVDPTETCGPGYGACPPDSECVLFPPGAGGTFACVPIFCSGPYPTCGGSCSGGRSCVPLDVSGSGFCVCVTPSSP